MIRYNLLDSDLRWLLAFVLGMIPLVAAAQESVPEPPVRYDTDFLPPAFHSERRGILIEKLPTRAVAVFFSAPERRRDGDDHHRYRQDANLYYLTGSTEPGTVLVLVPSGVEVDGVWFREILFVPPRTAFSGIWEGRRLGAEQAESVLGVEKALSNDHFNHVLSRLAERGLDFYHMPLPSGVESGSQLSRQLRAFDARAHTLDYGLGGDLRREVTFALGVDNPRFFARAKAMLQDRIEFDVDGGFEADILRAFVSADTFESWSAWKERHVERQYADRMLLPRLLTEMRMIKEPEELALLERAIEITVQAHKEILDAIRPGVHEYEVQACAEYIFLSEGAEGPAFSTVVGSGENAVVLRYSTNRRRMEQGDLVVVDMGAEYRGYAADVTRTLPVGGTFSAEQRTIYELVLTAQRAAIETARPGKTFSAPGKTAVSVIADGLLSLGLIERPEEVRRFFMHGTSHYLGLSVHDVGDYGTLAPGQVITVEPGVYIRPAADLDERWWNIGVRIEDSVLITDDGPRVLSEGAPRTVAEIENFMRDGHDRNPREE